MNENTSGKQIFRKVFLPCISNEAFPVLILYARQYANAAFPADLVQMIVGEVHRDRNRNKR